MTNHACLYCQKVMTRRKGETAKEFAARKHCNNSCSSKYKAANRTAQPNSKVNHDKLVAMYQSETQDVHAIAAAFKCAPPTVRRHLRLLGLMPESSTRDWREVDATIFSYLVEHTGDPYAVVALMELTGCGRGTVYWRIAQIKDYFGNHTEELPHVNYAEEYAKMEEAWWKADEMRRSWPQSEYHEWLKSDEGQEFMEEQNRKLQKKEAYFMSNGEEEIILIDTEGV
jgi:hypothetical protein